MGSDQPLVLRQAIRLIEEMVGRRAQVEFKPRHPADVLATWADIACARKHVGWAPEVDHRQGIEKLVQWYRDNREWAREIEAG